MNLKRDLPNVETGVAFAAFDNESIHQRETVLKLRSDDLLTVFLNGKEIVTHTHGVSETPIFLQAGSNKFLVKVEKKMPVWGFLLEVPRANF